MEKKLKEYGKIHFQNYLLIHKLQSNYYKRGLREFEDELLNNAKMQNLQIQKLTGKDWKTLNQIGRDETWKN